MEGTDVRGSLFAAIAVIAVVSFLLPQPAASMEFGADVQVVNNSNRQENPSVAVSAGGTIFVVWQDERNSAGSPDIYFARSADNGTSFSGATRVDDASANTDQLTPKIAVDSAGKLHALWSDARLGSYSKIYYANSTDNGTTWSANVGVNATGSGSQVNPGIAVDSSNNIYAIWEDTRSGYHIYMSKSTNGGTSFGASAKLDSSSSAARNPTICVAANDNLSVAWQDSRNSNWDIFLVTSTDSGSNFGSEINATKDTSSSSQTLPRLAADSKSNINLVWNDNRYTNNTVFWSTTTDGKTFSGTPVNDTDTGLTSAQAASIAVDSGDIARIVWQDKRPGSGYARIYYSELTSAGATTFITSVRVDNTTTATCSHPCITVDSNSVPSVVWDDDRNPSVDIFYDRPLNVPPFAPELTAPANDTWITSSKPAFNWTFKDVNSSDTQSAYQLQISATSAFATTTYDSGTVVSTTSSHTPSSALSEGSFYWRCRTRDKAGAWGPYSAGRLVKIDYTAPTAQTPTEAGVWSTSATVNFTWTPSSDNISGIAGYYVCIGTTAGGTDIVSDQWTATPNYTMSGGTNGTAYYAKIKATDNATNTGSYGGNSDGITVDTTMPTAATPSDTGLYTNSSLVKFSWAGSTDFPSGIAGYYVCIGSAAGLDDLVKDFWTASSAYTYAGGLNGVTYYAKIKAKDNATNVGGYSGSSDGITVDTSIPTTYSPVDNGTYSNTSTLYWFWPPSYDSPSGIAGYYVSVGTSYGGNDTVADRYTTATCLSLPGGVDGTTYYCRVYAVDNAGNPGPFSASSDGIAVDTTPPADFSVDDEGDWSRGNTTLKASWTSSFDDVSGVGEYRYAIGTAPNGTDVVNWTTAGTATSLTRKGLSLQNGVKYYITVRARNGAGLWSNLTATDGITVDMTVPAASVPSTANAWATSTSITWSWAASSDTPSGIRGYYVCIGTSAGGTDVVRDAFTPDASYTFPSGQNGRTYFAKVKAADSADNVGPYGADSSGTQVDISVPQAPTPSDEGQYGTKTSLLFSWAAMEDLPSGIEGYVLSIGTTPGGSDVLKDFSTTGLSYTLTNAVSGRTYYAKLRAVDGAGNAGPFSAPSDGIAVDLSPPGPVAVYGGGYQRGTAGMELSWSLAIDPETPVVDYLYAVGTTAGGTELIDWRSAGLRVSVSLGGLELQNGRSYFVSVRAKNAAGLLGNVSTGDPVTVDEVAPSASAPEPPGAFVNRSVITWAWNESADAESGIQGYFVSVGTTPGGGDIIDGAWTAQPSYTFIGGLNGATYYAFVRAVDLAGNVGPDSPASAGATVDTSLPSAYPPVAAASYSMFPNITWSWAPSADAPAGVAGYYVSLGTFIGGEDVVNDLWTAKTAYTYGSGADGKTYYIKLRAKDNAGNLGAFVTGTEGITVDLESPTGSMTIEGGAAATSRQSVMLAFPGASPDVFEMKVGSDEGLSSAAWEPFARTRSWMLSGADGQKTVYAQLRDRAGHESEVFSDSINLDTAVAPFKIGSSAGTETTGKDTTISSKVEPGSRVFVNGEQVAVGADGSFSRLVSLQDGSNVITVTVQDPAGNSQTLTKTVWKTPGALGGGTNTTLVLLLAVIAILLVVAVLFVSLRTQRLVAAHLREPQGPAESPAVKRRGRPPSGEAPETERPEEKVRPRREPWPTDEAKPAPGMGDERPPALAAGPEAPARPTQEEAYQVQPEPSYPSQPEPADIPPGPWAPAPGTTPYSALQEQLAAYSPAPRAPAPPVQAREGDMIIRADGTEQAAEPRLISEWSADTGQWQPVTDEQAQPEQAPAQQYEAPARQYEAQAAPQYGTQPQYEPAPATPGQALEEFARTAPAHAEPHARPETAPESPVPSAPAQRLSAKQIYAALYGKKAVPPGIAGQAPVAAAPGAPSAPATTVQAPAAASAPPDDRKVLGRARCASCKGIIPIYSTERPLRIKCPSCGLEGMIK
jgi:hypothetical protein